MRKLLNKGSCVSRITPFWEGKAEASKIHTVIVFDFKQYLYGKFPNEMREQIEDLRY